MSTVHKDKHGKVLKTDPGTKYHKDGTGPRNADGTPIAATTTTDAEPAAAAAADDARPASNKDAKK